MTRVMLIVFVCVLGGSGLQPAVLGDGQMQLGNFSVSLAVKDIAASRAFYEKLGFQQVAGDQTQNWLILQNSTSTIGLFQAAVHQEHADVQSRVGPNRQHPAGL